jgi:3-hydroxyisobutyrate dehydrogenase
VLIVAAGAAEAVALARGLGIDPQLFIDAVAGGPLDSPYLRTKASAIMKGDFSPSFAAEMAAKDGRLIVEAASLAGIHVDVAAAAAERLRRAVELGHAQEDMAAGYFASFDDR